MVVGISARNLFKIGYRNCVQLQVSRANKDPKPVGAKPIVGVGRQNRT